MALESEKVMFEIYRESTYQGRYKVVYFTELQDHNREYEINRAMAGDHFFDGFIRGFRKDEAKKAIDEVLQRLNAGESMAPADVQQELQTFLTS